jgi:separase
LDEIRQELSINLPSSIYSRILSSRLIERLFEFKQRTYTNPSTSNSRSPQNLLLFLDNHLHIFPWEQLHCMTSLFRRIVVYRLPSLLLLDGMHKYYYNSSENEQEKNFDNNDITIIPMEKPFYHRIDVDKGYYIVDPGNDLPRTKERFRKFQNEKPDLIEKWNGVIERFPTNDAIKDIFKSKDVLL